MSRVPAVSTLALWLCVALACGVAVPPRATAAARITCVPATAATPTRFWDQPSSWSPATVPGADDLVVLQNCNVTVRVDSSAITTTTTLGSSSSSSSNIKSGVPATVHMTLARLTTNGTGSVALSTVDINPARPAGSPAPPGAVTVSVAGAMQWYAPRVVLGRGVHLDCAPDGGSWAWAAPTTLVLDRDAQLSLRSPAIACTVFPPLRMTLVLAHGTGPGTDDGGGGAPAQVVVGSAAMPVWLSPFFSFHTSDTSSTATITDGAPATTTTDGASAAVATAAADDAGSDVARAPVVVWRNAALPGSRPGAFDSPAVRFVQTAATDVLDVAPYAPATPAHVRLHSDVVGHVIWRSAAAGSTFAVAAGHGVAATGVLSLHQSVALVLPFVRGRLNVVHDDDDDDDHQTARTTT